MTIIKTIAKRLTLLVALVALLTPSVAEIQVTKDAFRDVGEAYGYQYSQSHAIDEIAKKFPTLSRSAKQAQAEFLLTFKSSIQGLEEFSFKTLGSQWDEIKKQVAAQTVENFDADNVTFDIAKDFISEVHQRADGDMPSPIVETLLMFKSGYEEHPEREYFDGFKNHYVTNGEGKAKGVAFTIKTPQTWLAQEANRPNIVQKFTSQNGRGNEMLMVLVKGLGLPPGTVITKQDVAEFDIQDMLPERAVHTESGRMTLENLPGVWISYKLENSRLKTSTAMETILYAVYYQNKMILIQGIVVTAINGEPTNNGGLKRYTTLFESVANSLIMSDLYK